MCPHPRHDHRNESDPNSHLIRADVASALDTIHVPVHRLFVTFHYLTMHGSYFVVAVDHSMCYQLWNGKGTQISSFKLESFRFWAEKWSNPVSYLFQRSMNLNLNCSWVWVLFDYHRYRERAALGFVDVAFVVHHTWNWIANWIRINALNQAHN